MTREWVDASKKLEELFSYIKSPLKSVNIHIKKNQLYLLAA